MRNYQMLEAWKISMALVKQIYIITKEFPKEELYGLTSQIKRAAISIPSNIAEGMGRQYKKDNIQFQHIARGSVYELETLLNISIMVGILDEEIFNRITTELENKIKVLSGLINYLQKSELK